MNQSWHYQFVLYVGIALILADFLVNGELSKLWDLAWTKAPSAPSPVGSLPSQMAGSSGVAGGGGSSAG